MTRRALDKLKGAVPQSDTCSFGTSWSYLFLTRGRNTWCPGQRGPSALGGLSLVVCYHSISELTQNTSRRKHSINTFPCPVLVSFFIVRLLISLFSCDSHIPDIPFSGCRVKCVFQTPAVLSSAGGLCFRGGSGSSGLFTNSRMCHLHCWCEKLLRTEMMAVLRHTKQMGHLPRC